MSANWPWTELGLDGPQDERAVRRAYAGRLKAIDRDDAAAFQTLRSAYDAARARAKQAAPKRPSMSELAREGQPGLTSFDTPEHRTRDWMEIDEDEEAPAPISEISPEAVEPVLQREPEPEAEPEREPFPENPSNRYLDRLYEEWPLETRALFMERLRKSVRPFASEGTEELRELLALKLAQDFDLRRQAEWQIFSVLENFLRDDQAGRFNLAPNLGRVLEYEFDWYSDGVGFQKRFRGRSAASKIVEEMQRVVGKPNKTRKSPDRSLNWHYLAAYFVCTILAATMWGKWHAGYGPREYLVFGLIVAPALFGCWFVSAMVFVAFDFVAAHVVRSRLGAPLSKKWAQWRQNSLRIERLDGILFRAMGHSSSREKIVIWMAATLMATITIVFRTK